MLPIWVETGLVEVATGTCEDCVFFIEEVEKSVVVGGGDGVVVGVVVDFDNQGDGFWPDEKVELTS